MTNAVDRECAAVDFEAWPVAEQGHPEIELSDEGVRVMGETLRIALATMTRTKDEAVTVYQVCPIDGIEAIMDKFDGTADELRRLAAMLDAASARMLIAAEAILSMMAPSSPERSDRLPSRRVPVPVALPPPG